MMPYTTNKSSLLSARRIRLRTLFLLVALFAVAILLPLLLARENRRALAVGQRLGASWTLRSAPSWAVAFLPESVSREFWPRYVECECSIVHRDGASFTDDDLRDLPILKGLKRLVIPGSSVSDASIRRLGDLQGMREIDLHGTRITDESLTAISRLPELEYLRISNTAITDVGMKQLASLTRLKTLLVQDTALTDQAVAAIANVRSLKVLGIRGTAITSRAAAELRGLLPSVRLDSYLDHNRLDY